MIVGKFVARENRVDEIEAGLGPSRMAMATARLSSTTGEDSARASRS